MRRSLIRPAAVLLASAALTAGTLTTLVTGGVPGGDTAAPPVNPVAVEDPANVTRPSGPQEPTDRSGSLDAPRGALPAVAAASARSEGAIDTRRRRQVDRAYGRAWSSRAHLGSGWTGDSASCDKGTTSAEAATAMLGAVNFVRALSGLDPVRTRRHLDAAAQDAALLMAANEDLSHDPPRDWTCWSRAGADAAAASNLALALPSMSALRAVELYLDEPGTHNTAVGHRRWVMNPYAEEIGLASTGTTNAMTVVGGRQDQGNPSPRWTSWPTRGWFPAPLEPDGRWSVSSGRTGADFSRARVRVREVGGPRLRVRRQVPVAGFAMPTLAFDVDGVRAGAAYRVTVARVLGVGKGTKKRRTSFTVRLFEPRP